MNDKNKTYILIYKYSDPFPVDTQYLIKHDLAVKYAKNEDEALNIVRQFRVGVFLATYDSKDESSIYVLRMIMQQFPYIQRFLLAYEINSDILELAVNKAHINYFLLFPIEKEKMLVFLKKALRRFQNEFRPYDKLDKLTDVTIELVEDIEKYHEEATRDALTGLLNRRSFDQIISRFFNAYHKKNIPFVLTMLDLDKFKNINDTYGHSAGDIVLRKFGATMSGCSRLGEDFTFRYGGEEFAVLSHGESEADMRVYLNRLKSLVQKLEISYKDYKIKFTFSAGMAMMRKNVSLKQLVRNVDAALYYAKANGRNQIINYDNIK